VEESQCSEKKLRVRDPGRKEKRLDRETRLKIWARTLSESGEKPASWTERDERAWLNLKAMEAAAGKPTPSKQQQSERKQCMTLFKGAPGGEGKRRILHDYADQHTEDATGWPWFQAMQDGLARMGLPLFDRQPPNVETASQPEAAARLGLSETPASSLSQQDAVKKQLGGRVPSSKVELTECEENIWTVIQRGSKGRQYCRELDGASIKIRRVGVWKSAPPTYTAAYDAGKLWRHRIEDEKYKIKKKAKLARLAPRLASE
jgi:hypothetical protein